MGKTTGFLEYDRVDGPVRNEQQRTGDFLEFHMQLPLPAQQEQAARCMDCGVPFCQGGVMIAGMASGCPLHNLVPEVNDLVYRGRMEQAYRRLSITHSFPEFTCRVCPALCEAACTCGLHDAPVSTKENEKAVIEYAFAKGLVEEETPSERTGKKVAVIGSGPSGLAAAQQLNRRGHEVTVYERKDRIGGLLRYGIPNMKLDKSVIDRRMALMEQAGVRFVTGVDVGKDITAADLEKEYISAINPNVVFTEEVVSEGNDDYSSVVTNFQAAGVETVICAATYTLSAPFAKQMRTANPDINLIAHGNCQVSQLTDILGEQGDNFSCSCAWSPIFTDEGTKYFVEKYAEKDDATPIGDYAQYYDTVGVLLQAITNVGSTDREAIRAELATIEYDGLSGHLNFDENRDCPRDYGIVYWDTADSAWHQNTEWNK